MKKDKPSILRSGLLESLKEASPSSSSLGAIGRIHTKRIVRLSDGRLLNISPRAEVLLVEMETINQVVVEGRLEEAGVSFEVCPRLIGVNRILRHFEVKPYLIVFGAQAVRRQLLYFRNAVLSLVNRENVPHLLNHVPPDEIKRFSSWYEGQCVLEGDLDGLLSVTASILESARQRAMTESTPL